MKPKSYLTTTIVLVLITIIVTYFIVSKSPANERCIRLSVAAEGKGICTGDTFSKMRHYKIYSLTNDANENKSILTKIRIEVNSLKDNKDTINGIDIVLNEQSTYQDFISVLDICREKKPASFASFKNHVYSFYVKAD